MLGTRSADLNNSRVRDLGLPFGDTQTSVGDQPSGTLPATYSLRQNYPNPFNPSTSIAYSLPQPSAVTLRVYSILGQEVSTLVDTDMPAGHYVNEWNGTDRHGDDVSTGVYLYRIEAGTYTETKKMLLMK